MRVWVWVCVCVCVCVSLNFPSTWEQRIIPSVFVAHFAGQCVPDSHCPTKTLSVHGEIWPDQPDAPVFGLAD